MTVCFDENIYIKSFDENGGEQVALREFLERETAIRFTEIKECKDRMMFRVSYEK